MNSLNKYLAKYANENAFEREPLVYDANADVEQHSNVRNQATDPYVDKAMKALSIEDPKHPAVLDLAKLIEQQFNRISNIVRQEKPVDNAFEPSLERNTGNGEASSAY